MEFKKRDKALDWVKEFYRKQGQWSHCYRGPVTESHKRRVETLERIGGSPPKDMLELGGGGGQLAVTAASRGYDVVFVDQDPSSILHARDLARGVTKGSMTVIEGDFYEVELTLNFHVICYFDGFGIGLDIHQRELLKRICHWLIPGGTALIEVYTPWYWAQESGREMRWGSLRRRYGFDPYQCCMLDTWWREGEEEEAVTQSLRCYSPADLELLLEGTGLHLVDVVLTEDIEEGVKDLDSLFHAMSYLAIIRHHRQKKNGN